MDDRLVIDKLSKLAPMQEMILTQDAQLLFPGMSEADIDARLRRLRVQNIVMGVLHLGQAIAVYLLNETGFTLPISGTYPQGPPGTPADLIEVGSLDVGLWVFLFLAIAGANIAMIAFGDLQERYLKPGQSLLPFWLGTLVGLAPWIAIVVDVLSIGDPDRDLSLVPGFVWVIVFALFAFYFSFGLNQWLQYKRIGGWANYFRGETTYVLLSLVAKSLLAWLVFANTLIPPD